MSLRMACLEGRRQELAALTEVFADADETVVEKAIFATSSLRRLWGCADVEALMSEVKPPEDATTRRAVESMRAQLARVKALTEAGKFKEALELATEVAQKAPTLGYSPVHAEALFLQAWVQIISGENKGVPPLLTEALWLAHASRHDTIATASTVRLMGYYSQRGPPEETHRWESLRAGLAGPAGRERGAARHLPQQPGPGLLPAGQLRRGVRVLRQGLRPGGADARPRALDDAALRQQLPGRAGQPGPHGRRRCGRSRRSSRWGSRTWVPCTRSSSSR